jgi:hypothetical protein
MLVLLLKEIESIQYVEDTVASVTKKQFNYQLKFRKTTHNLI